MQRMIESNRLRRAYTLIEMLTTIAVLVIVMGLMVRLARRVRAQSARALTESVLLKLDVLMAQYVSRNHRLPVVSSFVPEGMKEGERPEEPLLQRSALRNNRELVRVLRGQVDLEGAAGEIDLAAQDADQLAVVAQGAALEQRLLGALALLHALGDERRHHRQTVVTADVLRHQHVELQQHAFGQRPGRLRPYPASEAYHQAHHDHQYGDGGEHLDERVCATQAIRFDHPLHARTPRRPRPSVYLRSAAGKSKF